MRAGSQPARRAPSLSLRRRPDEDDERRTPTLLRGRRGRARGWHSGSQSRLAGAAAQSRAVLMRWARARESWSADEPTARSRRSQVLAAASRALLDCVGFKDKFYWLMLPTHWNERSARCSRDPDLLRRQRDERPCLWSGVAQTPSPRPPRRACLHSLLPSRARPAALTKSSTSSSRSRPASCSRP